MIVPYPIKNFHFSNRSGGMTLHPSSFFTAGANVYVNKTNYAMVIYHLTTDIYKLCCY